MTRRIRLVGTVGGLELLDSSDQPGDPGSVAALAVQLSADYPLIDVPLIIAILSDYDPSTVHSRLEEIRDQLGILEATLVADPDDVPAPGADESTSEKLSTDGEPDYVKGLEKLSLGPNSAGRSRSAECISSKRNSTSGRATEMSRSTSASASGSSGKSTSPTSVVEDDESYVGELELLMTLFPAVPHKTVRDALSNEPSLPAAIDHLLSIELIRDVERREFWPGEENVASDSEIEHLAGPSSIASALPPVDHPLNPAASVLSPSRSSSTTRKSRKKAQRIIPLVDTLQRKPSPRPTLGPPSRTALISRRPLPNRLNSSNAWHTIASLAAYLAEILPTHPTSYYMRYLHSPDHHSAYAAVRASLTALPTKAVSNDERAEAILQEVYGITLLEESAVAARERDQTRADLEISVKAAGADVATVMDLMDLLADISLWPSDDDDELQQYDQYISRTSPRTTPTASPKLAPSPLLQTPSSPKPNPDRLLSRPTSMQTEVVERVIPGSRPAASSIANPTAYDDFGQPSRSPAPIKCARPDRQIHLLNWRTVNHERMHRARSFHPHAAHIPSYALGITPHDPTPGSLYGQTVSGEVDINECLRRAAAAREKRGEAVRAAGRSFKGTIAGGKAANGSIAGHYALQAREAAENARQWEMKAARIIVSSQLERTGHTIDLHHLTIQEASTLAIEAAGRWWERQKAVQHQGNAVSASQRPVSVVPGQALTIVTGVGRHSAGKRGVLGPSVANVLEGDGWRVDRGENGRGYLVVRGRR